MRISYAVFGLKKTNLNTKLTPYLVHYIVTRLLLVFFFIQPRPPISSLTDPLFPYSTLVRSLRADAPYHHAVPDPAGHVPLGVDLLTVRPVPLDAGVADDTRGHGHPLVPGDAAVGARAARLQPIGRAHV